MASSGKAVKKCSRYRALESEIHYAGMEKCQDN